MTTTFLLAGLAAVAAAVPARPVLKS
jgi:hypothetical protein